MRSVQYWGVAKSRPSDPMQLAKLVGDIATGQVQDAPTPSEEVRRYMRELGRLGGLKGGPERKRSLSKKRRSAIARKAAKTRWQG